MRKQCSIIMLSALLCSCTFIRMDDSIDLGAQYRYIQDYPQTIIYHPDKEYHGIGTEIAGPVVLDYKFDDGYIIAKSQEVDEMTGDSSGRPIHYWIIDKSKAASKVEPLDSISFYKQKAQLGIELNL